MKYDELIAEVRKSSYTRNDWIRAPRSGDLTLVLKSDLNVRVVSHPDEWSRRRTPPEWTAKIMGSSGLFWEHEIWYAGTLVHVFGCWSVDNDHGRVPVETAPGKVSRLDCELLQAISDCDIQDYVKRAGLVVVD